MSSNVDWDRIEADPAQLVSAVADGLELTLQKYGTPRGEVAATAAAEAIQNHKVEAPTSQAQQALDKIEEMDMTELSDDDFAKQLGITMKAHKALGQRI